MSAILAGDVADGQGDHVHQSVTTSLGGSASWGVTSESTARLAHTY